MPPELPINDMDMRHVGLTKPLADSYSEAASVCLNRHHRSPTQFTISCVEQESHALATWMEPTQRILNAWRNDIDTTEAGACACALAALELSLGLVAVCRAETRTGADYYLAQSGDQLDDLEDCLRLEVSGSILGPQRSFSIDSIKS